MYKASALDNFVRNCRNDGCTVNKTVEKLHVMGHIINRNTIKRIFTQLEIEQETNLRYSKWFQKAVKHPENLVQNIGICTNFFQIFHVRLNHAMREKGISYDDWPLYSGNDVFPVTTQNPDDETRLYYHTDKKYDKTTEYGRARLNLLTWLNNQFAK